MDWSAFGLSLRLALATLVLLLPLAALLAWPLAFGRFRGRAVAEALLNLPLVLPPTVVGFYLLVAFGPASPVGRLWAALTGEGLAFSFGGLLLASALINLPFAVQPLLAALGQVDRACLEAAATLGAGPWRRYMRVALPLAWRGLATGAVLTFAHTLGEFGVVLMVGGNLPGRTRTASIALFDQVQALDLGAAHRTALTLVLLAMALLTLSALLRPKAAR
jgi:molybdate transport system permease protein